jgi:diacylglycerol kinase (ATP)
MSLHIGIVLKPHARRTSRALSAERLEADCARLVGRGDVTTTLRVTQGVAELPQVVAELHRRGADVLAVCGGDGTLMATISAAVETYGALGAPLPPLLILPGGTMNTVARNLSATSRGAPLQALDKLARLVAEQGRRGLSRVPRFQQPLMRITTEGEGEAASRSGLGRPRTRYGCIFGAAMGARYLAEYSRRPGLLWAVWLGLRTIGSSLYPGGGRFARWLFQRTAAELTIDGELAPESAFRLLLCATVPDVGLGMRVPWRAGCVPGRFQVVASSLPLMKNALQLLRMQRGQPLLGTPHLDRMAQEAVVRFSESQPLTLDGELFSAPLVKLSLGPPLEVLLP